MPEEAIITLPDGRKARITGPTREAIIEKVKGLTGASAPGQAAGSTRSAVGVALDTAGRQVADNVMALPSATGDVLAAAAAGVGGTAALLTGSAPEYRARFREEQERFPASLLRAIPRPTSRDVDAALASIPALLPGGESPGEAFERHRAAGAATEAAERAAHPVAATVGEIGGDVASLLTGRVPIARFRAGPNAVKWEGFGPGMQVRVKDGAESLSRVAEMPPGARKLLNTAWDSRPMRSLRRGAGRAGETGLEAAALSILHEGDPMQAAAWGAASQAGGSFLLSGTQDVFKLKLGSAGMKMGVAAVAIGSMLQVIKEATPGGRDRVLESLETGYSKVMLAIAGGALSGMAGLGRLRGGDLEKNLPAVADAITAIPRGAVLSTLADLTSDDPRAAQGQAILERLTTDPGSFTEKQLRELNRGLNDRKFLDAVERIEKQKPKVSPEEMRRATRDFG